MRPQPAILAERIRNFPSLVHCCTMDYFFPWPEEALTSVARAMIPVSKTLEQEDRDAICSIVAKIHISFDSLADKYFKDSGVRTYAPLTKFLDFIKLFVTLHKQYGFKLRQEKKELDIGI